MEKDFIVGQLVVWEINNRTFEGIVKHYDCGDFLTITVINSNGVRQIKESRINIVFIKTEPEEIQQILLLNKLKGLSDQQLHDRIELSTKEDILLISDILISRGCKLDEINKSIEVSNEDIIILPKAKKKIANKKKRKLLDKPRVGTKAREIYDYCLINDNLNVGELVRMFGSQYHNVKRIIRLVGKIK
jgi:hypothetical protein